MQQQDKVQFFVGESEYTDRLKSYSLKWDMFEGAGSFNCDVDPYIEEHLYNSEARQFIWAINGYAMMTGYIDKVQRSYNKSSGSNTCSIFGRDMMQVLLDNHVLYPKSYADQPLKTMIDDILATSSSINSITNFVTGSNDAHVVKLTRPLAIPTIGIEFTPQALNIIKRVPDFKKMKSNHGQSIFEFVSSIANQVGIFMYNVPGTNTIMLYAVNPPIEGNKPIQYDMNCQVSTDAAYPINNVVGGANNNVKACTFTEDVTNFFKYIKVIGQCNDEELYGIIKTKMKLRIDKIEGIDNDGSLSVIGPQDLQKGYTGVTKFLSKKVNEVDLNAWQKTRDLIINNLLLQQNRKLFSIRYMMMNHSPSGSLPYFFNHLATVNDDVLGRDIFKNRQFLVYALEFKGSKDQGQSTDLDLSAPTLTNLGQWLRG